MQRCHPASMGPGAWTLFLWASCAWATFAIADGAEPPRVFLIDADTLVEVRGEVAAGKERFAPAIARLREEADGALREGPFSVMDKAAVPPSGDKHDYMSVGPYWWPDPAKPDGKPYIRRDGQVNPERNDYDSGAMKKMCEAVDTLALAYYLTGHEPYAAHATKLLRAWFLDPATRMNPHLEYGQAIPGRCTGRGIGIIDTTSLVRLVDAVGLLDESTAWKPDDQQGLEAWFAEYLEWMLTSRHGRAEAATKNNHATWYDVQVAALALFVGDVDTARSTLAAAGPRRIATQIEPDGRQPHELARTRSFDYSTMNLTGMFALASLGERVGVDLWRYRSDDGRNLRAALDWLVPYAAGNEAWANEQITPLVPQRLTKPLRQAAIAYHAPSYAGLADELLGREAARARLSLLYPPP